MNILKRKGIRNFIKEVDKDIKVKFQKYDMECDVFEETVYIGKQYDANNENYFMQYVKEIAPDCKVPALLLSILHEIGHIYTWEEDEADEKDKIYGLLSVAFEEDKDVAKYNDMYFRIPLEHNATMWGIEYAGRHPELIEKYKWLCK